MSAITNDNEGADQVVSNDVVDVGMMPDDRDQITDAAARNTSTAK
jgi:hypothetical protein